MKKFILLALIVSAPTMAATTGTLLLKGVVPQILDITVTPTALATTLPLQTTQNQAQVATVATKWNAINGARVTVSSANGGQLRHATITTSVVPYTLHAPAAGTFSLATPQQFDAPIAGPQNASQPLNINYTGVPLENLVEGNYSDTITFTISAL